MPAETAATPKPCRSPFGEASGPSSRAAAIDLVHGPPTGHPAPGPETGAAAATTAGLQLAHPVHHVEGVQQGRRDGHAAVDARPSLLEALEREHAGGEVHPIGGEGERLGQAAAGIGEGHAEGAHGAHGLLRLAQEFFSLYRGQVFS